MTPRGADTAGPTRRPAIVTTAIVVVYVGGLSNTALGLLLLLSRYRVPADEVLGVSLGGAAMILLGLLTVAGGSSLSRGSALARTLLTGYLALLFTLHLLSIVTTDWDVVVVIEILAESFVILAIWTPPGRRYFRAPNAARAAPTETVRAT
jgi:hypothetical protein